MTAVVEDRNGGRKLPRIIWICGSVDMFHVFYSAPLTFLRKGKSKIRAYTPPLPYT